MTGQSLYYPRVMMRTLAQVLTEEYSEFGVHVANVVIDGTIDSPGTRALPKSHNQPDTIINPVRSPRRSTTCTPRIGRAGHTNFSSRHFRPGRATDGAGVRAV